MLPAIKKQKQMSKLIKGERYSYTNIDNTVFFDNRLSAKAKGVLCQMLSLPDNWEYSVEGLTTRFSDGKASIRSAITELEQYGYLVRRQVKKGGKYAGVDYLIYANPKNAPNTDFQIAENQTAEIQTSENQTAENRTQLITKESTTNELITNSLNTKESLNIEFENLWSLYPRKQGKASAFRHYQKARKSGAVYEEIEQGILAYTEYIRANNIDMQYVKMGSTFFSQKAWNDDWTIRHPKQESRRDLFARLYEEHRDDI